MLWYCVCVVQLNPVLIDSKFHGQFYSGDCYIVLNTYEVKNRISQDLHFWLGTLYSNIDMLKLQHGKCQNATPDFFLCLKLYGIY